MKQNDQNYVIRFMKLRSVDAGEVEENKTLNQFDL